MRTTPGDKAISSSRTRKRKRRTRRQDSQFVTLWRVLRQCSLHSVTTTPLIGVMPDCLSDALARFRLTASREEAATPDTECMQVRRPATLHDAKEHFMHFVNNNDASKIDWRRIARRDGRRDEDTGSLRALGLSSAADLVVHAVQFGARVRVHAQHLVSMTGEWRIAFPAGARRSDLSAHDSGKVESQARAGGLDIAE